MFNFSILLFTDSELQNNFIFLQTERPWEADSQAELLAAPHDEAAVFVVVRAVGGPVLAVMEVHIRYPQIRAVTGHCK